MSDVRYLPTLTVEEETVQGAEPIRRTAYLGDELVLTGYGNIHEDRWILGWPTIHEDWVRLISAAALQCAALPIDNVIGFALYDEQFEEVGAYRLESELPDLLTKDFMRVVRGRRRLPDMMVVGDKEVVAQVEVIFDPATGNPSSMTLMASSATVRQCFRLVQITHASAAISGDREVARAVLNHLCTNAPPKETSNGQAVESGRLQYIHGGTA